MLQNGEDSFAVRMATLKAARKSIRIQALVFKGDEAGLRIAEVLKEKKAAGLDVRVIVDAFSNPWLQTQWLFFDLKQHGIEVEGYEAMALQWLNEVPIPTLTPHFDPAQPDKRFHEKMWIIDGETDARDRRHWRPQYRQRLLPHGPGGSRTTLARPGRRAARRGRPRPGDGVRPQFRVLRRRQESRGILNTNLYWDATRKVLDKTGKVPISYDTDPAIVANVAAIEARQPALEFRPSTCRFIQNRPRLKETYIQQAYVKLIERARARSADRQRLLRADAFDVAALTDAARRCVAVKLISNSPETNDLPEISLVGRGYYKDLLAVNDSPEVAACRNEDAGLRIWEWVGQSADEAARSQGTMHSKFAVSIESAAWSAPTTSTRAARNSTARPRWCSSSRNFAAAAASLPRERPGYSREVTPELAAQFEAPESVIERFRKSIGHLFEDHL